jgi:hypothetical protein
MEIDKKRRKQKGLRDVGEWRRKMGRIYRLDVYQAGGICACGKGGAGLGWGGIFYQGGIG